MTADEIRSMEVDDTGLSNERMLLIQARNQSRILREIAAQLAELNSTLRVQSAILAGEGSPQ